MKKYIIIIFAVIIIVTLVVLSGIFMVDKQTDDASITEKNSSQVFFYELKEKYHSQTEIKEEQNNLQYAFLRFTHGKDKKAEEEAERIYHEIWAVLDEKLKEIPPTEEEILAQTVHNLEMQIEWMRLDLYSAELELKAFPDNAEYQARYKKEKHWYDSALAIEKDFRKGKISAQEALDKVKALYMTNP